MADHSADEHRDDRMATVEKLKSVLQEHGDDLPMDARHEIIEAMWTAHPDRRVSDSDEPSGSTMLRDEYVEHVSTREVTQSVNESLDEDFPEGAGRLS